MKTNLKNIEKNILVPLEHILKIMEALAGSLRSSGKKKD